MASEADNLPPAPAERSITPAPEDYTNPPAIPNMLWPLFWIGVAFACWKVVEATGWIEWSGSH